MKHGLTIALIVIIMMFLPSIGMAHASEPKTLTFEMSLTPNEVIKDGYLFNPENVNMSNNSLVMGKMVNNHGSVTGIQLTTNDILNYMIKNKMITKGYTISKIMSYHFKVSYNITKTYNEYLKYYAKMYKESENAGYNLALLIRTWVGEPKIETSPYENMVLSDNEESIIIHPLIQRTGENQLANVTSYILFGAYSTSNVAILLDRDNNIPAYLVNLSKNSNYMKSYNTTLSIENKYYIFNNNEETSIYGNAFIDVKSPIATNGENKHEVMSTLSTNQLGLAVSGTNQMKTIIANIPKNLVGLYFATDFLYYGHKNPSPNIINNITAPEIKNNIDIVISVQVEPQNYASINYSYILPMIGLGLLFVIFGAYNYDYEMNKGISLSLGLSLLISSLLLYLVPIWQYSWLLILMPLTFTVLLTYTLIWKKIINSTKHPRFEYWMLKWGDALSLVLMIIMVIEMFTGILTNTIPPFWGVS